MSAWAQAVWIVNKLTADWDLSQLKDAYNTLSQRYDDLIEQHITITQQYSQDGQGNIILPDGDFLDGTICLLYEEEV